jgi:hypothetical protein
VGLESGVAVSDEGIEQAGMGVDFGDYDNDGWLDITKTNFAFDHNNLYHNEQNGQFSEHSSRSGIAQVTMPFVSWGTRFLDYDNDGWKDIFVATGHTYPYLIDDPTRTEKYYQQRLLFRNLASGAFEDASRSSGSGILQEKSSRGAAFGDLDNDGDMDVVVLNMDDHPSILRNDGGSTNNWITVRLRGRASNRFGLGARVFARTDSLVQISEATTAGSVYSASDPRVHFGLGRATRLDLEIRWPSGRIQTLAGVTANRIVEVDEEQGLR